jgi:hypothetical protein
MNTKKAFELSDEIAQLTEELRYQTALMSQIIIKQADLDMELTNLDRKRGALDHMLAKAKYDLQQEINTHVEE